MRPNRRLLIVRTAMAAVPFLVLAVAFSVVKEVKYGLPSPLPLERLDPTSPSELARRFAEIDYRWPPDGSVPPIAVAAFPAGMDSMVPEQKKSLFFRTLLPIVLAENRLLAERRAFVGSMFATGTLDPGSNAWEAVAVLARRYRVGGDLNDPAERSALLRRLDTVPVALVLAQAANESAWGASRFAREANNLFGVWTYRDGEGLVPRDRPDGENHLVRVFPDIRSSIRDYLFNINVGAAYRDLRLLRAAMRARGAELDAVVLAGGLARYSQRGMDYVAEVRAIIRSNGLDRLGRLRLAGRALYAANEKCCANGNSYLAALGTIQGWLYQ